MDTGSRTQPAGGVLAPFARRDLMRAGAGLAVLGAAGLPKAAAAATPTQADLFAFRAVDDTVVFAVAFPDPSGSKRTAPAGVRIHAGPTSWTLEGSGRAPTLVSFGHGVRGYVGRIGKPTPQGLAPYHLAVVAAPSIVTQRDLGVWAEISAGSGDRLRIGNPIVSHLLAQDPELRRIFHKALPSQDRALFAEALADRIAEQSATSRDTAAEHGVRLADLLLPDVLPFDPGRPVGFTFAGQNGRAPSDRVGDIVDTVLAGVVSPRLTADRVFRSARAFPYFEGASIA